MEANEKEILFDGYDSGISITYSKKKDSFIVHSVYDMCCDAVLESVPASEFIAALEVLREGVPTPRQENDG